MSGCLAYRACLHYWNKGEAGLLNTKKLLLAQFYVDQFQMGRYWYPISTAKQSISNNSSVGINETPLDAFRCILFDAYAFVSSLIENHNISKNASKPIIKASHNTFM